MATTSNLKERKFEETQTDIGRTGDIDLGTDEIGVMQNSLDGSNNQYEKTIQVRCSPTRFVKLCTELRNRAKIKNEFPKAVSEMGFSSLLEMSSCAIFRPLLGWLIEKFDVGDASLCVHRKRFILTPSTFEMVVGVKDGGEDFEQKGSKDDVKRRRDAVMDGKATLSLTQLENNLNEAESVDDLFVTRFVLFTVGALLMPTTSSFVGTSMLGSINGSESLRRKNWATKSFIYLVEAIRDFKKKKGAFVGGCVLFLQVFYLHHLVGHNQYIDRSLFPIAAWSEKKSKDVITWINENFGYGSKNIQMRGMDDGCSKCQSMHSDIKNCKLEIQEVKQLVIGLQQSHREDMKKISKMVMDLMESFKSGREGVARENGGDRIVRSDIIVLNDDDSDDSLDADPLDMYKSFVSSGGKKIGPFRLSQPLSDADSNKIALYIVNKSLDESEVVARFGFAELSRLNLQEPLLSGECVEFEILDAYASMLNGVVGMQYEIPENRECWFLPSSLSTEAKYVGLDRLLDDMDLYDAGVVQWREYFGNLSKCTKFVIPVSRFGYWAVAVINLREENVELWDYVVVAKPESISDREKDVIEMLRLLDHVLADVLADGVNMAFPNGLSLQSFKIIHKKYEHCTEKFLDSAIYIMRHMWAASKGLDSFPKFNPKEFLLEVYIELVRSQFNEVSASMLEKSGAHYDSLIRETKRAGKGKIDVLSSNSQGIGQFLKRSNCQTIMD